MKLSILSLVAMLFASSNHFFVNGQMTTQYGDHGDEQTCSCEGKATQEFIERIQREVRDRESQSEEELQGLREKVMELRNLTEQQRQHCDLVTGEIRERQHQEEELAQSLRREMTELRNRCEQQHQVIADNEHLIANLSSRFEQLLHQHRVLETLLPHARESCRWSASRGQPRLISGTRREIIAIMFLSETRRRYRLMLSSMAAAVVTK